ncbi:TolC family protein [Microbulbifer pacificus]|uniref:TolC family protein n=1 Tax=Microbulbifer pacificus TaxID=407164 RepID=A0AAU0MY82_9GAMM|nr:TolC family protein [Microbulbifer pacificus]WOX05645.1 TolC family protein [Microbulbifer pacificus]
MLRILHLHHSRYWMHLSRPLRLKTATRLVCCVCAAFLGGQPSQAQDGTVLPRLSYEQAIFQSLRSHPDLAGYEFRLQAAAADAEHAALGPRPELGLEIEDVAGTGDVSGVESAQTTLGISWLLQCDVIDKRVQAAQREVAVIGTQQQIAALDIAADSARYFLQVVAQQERLTLVQRAVVQAQRGLADIRRHVRAGKLPQAEASRASAEVERRSLAAEDVEHEYAVAKYRLAAQWGERTPAFSAVVGSLSAPLPDVDIAYLRQQVTNNPTLAIFLNRERVADAEIALARAEAGIQWRLEAGIRRLEASNDFGLVAGVAIPLGRRDRNAAKVAALQANQNQYRAERNAQEIALETRVYVMAEQLRHSRHVAHAMTERIIPSLEQALADTQHAYQQGKYSYYELASAQQDLIDARLSYLEAQYTAHLYLIEIEKLTGLSLAQFPGYSK